MQLKACLIFSTAFLIAQPQTAVVFDAASVKSSHLHIADGQKGEGPTGTAVAEAHHLTFRARGMTLFGLVVIAYGLRSCRPLIADSCRTLSGGPTWLRRDTFDIDAKSPAGSKEYDTMQLRNGDAPQLQEELRNLLTDRFSLKVHFDKRQLPVFAFCVAKSGIRMKKADGGESPKIVFKEINSANGLQATQVVAVRSTIQELAELYSKFMDRPVIDMTGLTDRFDFMVQYEADTDSRGPFAAITAPTLFQAFEKQAGLKLSATRGPVNVLVVDNAARPSAN